MSSEAVYGELANAVLSFDSDKVLETTRKALDLGLGPGDIIENGLGKGLRMVGEKFERCEIWLMHACNACGMQPFWSYSLEEEAFFPFSNSFSKLA